MGSSSRMRSAETTYRFSTPEVTVTPLHRLLLRSCTIPHCKTLLGTTVSDGQPERRRSDGHTSKSTGRLAIFRQGRSSATTPRHGFCGISVSICIANGTVVIIPDPTPSNNGRTFRTTFCLISAGDLSAQYRQLISRTGR